MKYLSYTIFVLFLLISCGDDDDDSNPNTSITGSYIEIEHNKVDCPDPADNENDQCDPSTDTCDAWEFTAEGKAILTYGYGGNTVFDYTIQGDKLTLVSSTGSGLFIINQTADKLTLTENGSNRCLTQYVLEK